MSFPQPTSVTPSFPLGNHCFYSLASPKWLWHLFTLMGKYKDVFNVHPKLALPFPTLANVFNPSKSNHLPDFSISKFKSTVWQLSNRDWNHSTQIDYLHLNASRMEPFFFLLRGIFPYFQISLSVTIISLVSSLQASRLQASVSWNFPWFPSPLYLYLSKYHSSGQWPFLYLVSDLWHSDLTPISVTCV